MGRMGFFLQAWSDERNLLEDIRNERWLVSLVHHDYKDPKACGPFV